MVLEISIVMSQLPSAKVADGTWRYRTIGLGYANLGALMMRLGYPYDSDEARGLAASLTAILTGQVYAQSARIAGVKGPFDRYSENRDDMLRVIRNHKRAADGQLDGYEGLAYVPSVVSDGSTWSELVSAARASWSEAYGLGQLHGYRNAQASCLAPTGTIGLLMDCDTTGIEPDYSLVKHKELAGGGFFKIINQSVPPALFRLGYADEQVRDIVTYVTGNGCLDQVTRSKLVEAGFTEQMLEDLNQAFGTAIHFNIALNMVKKDDLVINTDVSVEDLASGRPLPELLGLSTSDVARATAYACGLGTIEGAPHLDPEHYAVFDCAGRCGWTGTRYISPEGHVDMMAAVQPFLSGAISKTVNLPRTAVISDMDRIFRRAWRRGGKAVALYRNGSKLSQPLDARASQDLFDGLVEHKVDDVPKPQSEAPEERVRVIERVVEKLVVRYLSERRKLPYKRSGYTQKVIIGRHKVFLRTGEYADGTLGEIFVDMHKEGAAFRSLMSAFSIAVSVGLQHGVPLERYVDLFTFFKFEPQGPVWHDDRVRMCTSIIDWIFRNLAVNYLDREDLAHVSADALQSDTVGEGSRPKWSEERVLEERVIDVPASYEGSEPFPMMLRTEPIDVNDPGLPSCDTEERLIASTHSLATKKLSEEQVHGAEALASVSLDASSVAEAHGYEGDACEECGNMTLVRSGNCTRCLTCSSGGLCG
jgi:ribonucleoside-diphosphate reductase alpha chain